MVILFSMQRDNLQKRKVARLASISLIATMFLAESALSATLLPSAQFVDQEPLSSNHGHAHIQWESSLSLEDLNQIAPEWEFLLEMSSSLVFDDAVTLYQGQDQATFVSGLANGSYYYRVSVMIDHQLGPWSHPLLLEVEHYSMTFAISLFVLGFLTFVAILSVIVIGNRKAFKEAASL